MKWLGIDVGYHNLALVQMDTESKSVLYMNKIDISRYTHTKVCFAECCLHHTNHVTDYIRHFIQEYDWIFQDSDKIFMERQPPTGLTNVEALLYDHYRDKMDLVSPNRMHAHFRIGHLDYEKRKEKVVEISRDYLGVVPFQRKHDIADACCILLYEMSKIKKKRPSQPRLDFDEYRFMGNG